jgi:hypothetical protein
MTFSAKTLLPLCLPLLLAGSAAHATGNFELDPEPMRPQGIRETPEWKEGALTLPPWPQDADLVAFVPEGTESPFRFFIDGRSLKVDASGSVVRYTLVVASGSGVRNVSYEGIRCTLKGAYRLYAYGSNGRFIATPGSDWLPIPETGTESYRDDLHRHRFCIPRETRPRPVKGILRALRNRGGARESTGFQAD